MVERKSLSSNVCYSGYMILVFEEIKRHPYRRLGQTLFNVLYGYRMDWAEEIRGTNLDPFHYNEGEVILNFTKYLIKKFEEE